MLFELETDEVKYLWESSGRGHFAIDCACKGKNGLYGGSHYKNLDSSVQDAFDSMFHINMNRYEHTFLVGEMLFTDELKFREDESNPLPLVIVCNDCKREFPFTLESYHNLKQKMRGD